MDPRFHDLNPLSDAFRREAARNVQQNVGAIKSQKELKDAAGRGSLDDVEDAVLLHGSAEPFISSQDGAGKDVATLTGRGGAKEGCKTSSAPPGEAERMEDVVEGAAGLGLLEEQDPRAARRRSARARRMAEHGVPPEILQASRHIVEGQVDPVRGPRSSLQGIKTPPETSQMQMEPADYASVMEIHDVANAPMVVEEPEPGI